MSVRSGPALSTSTSWSRALSRGAGAAARFVLDRLVPQRCFTRPDAAARPSRGSEHAATSARFFETPKHKKIGLMVRSPSGAETCVAMRLPGPEPCPQRPAGTSRSVVFRREPCRAAGNGSSMSPGRWSTWPSAPCPVEPPGGIGGCGLVGAAAQLHVPEQVEFRMRPPAAAPAAAVPDWRRRRRWMVRRGAARRGPRGEGSGGAEAAVVTRKRERRPQVEPCSPPRRRRPRAATQLSSEAADALPETCPFAPTMDGPNP